MFHNTKNIFLFILIAFVGHSCDSSDTTETDQDVHTDADGMEIVTMLEGEEAEMYSECLGDISNEFSSGVPAGTSWEFTVHFLDDNCEELEHDDDDHDGHDHGDDDHDDHGDDEAYLLIETADGGSSIISISTEEDHDDHEDGEHCEDLMTETECGEHDECEWHADDMACEDADHDDHAHCEDFMSEAECGEHDECEWHADDMACEDAEHDDHDDHDDHDEEHGYTFELETLTPGTTTFTVKLMHEGHSDYTSAPITIVVE